MPSLSPALEIAPPGPTTGWRPGGRVIWEALYRDGVWRNVTIRAWWTSQGRQVVQVEWHADGGTWGESYYYDPARMRDPDPGE